MPITFRIEGEQGIVRVTARGMITADEVRNYRRDLVAHPQFGPGLNLLVDATETDTSALTRGGLEALAEDWKTILPPNGTLRIAIFVDTQAAFGLARMYEVLTEETPIIARAFLDSGEALAWLQETAVPRR